MTIQLIRSSLTTPIGFNDFRGTALQITLTPEELDNHNDISRNLGDNRGHGLHPSLFSPDGQVQQIADPVGVSIVWGSCVPIQRVSSNLCAGEHGNMFSVQLTGLGASK